MTRILAVAALRVSLALLGGCGSAIAELPASTVIEFRQQSVVAVLPVWKKRPANAEEPEGSGVVVGDGTLVVTADHILGNAARVRIRTSDGEVALARILARDSETDLALLGIPFSLPAMAFAGYPVVGEEVCAIGNAFGLGVSVTCGTVSAVRRSGIGFNPIEDFIQTDAAVNPGMSGGALIDGEGALVGVLSAIFTKQSDANIGVNFAVSGPLAKLALTRLQTGAKTAWPRAGLQLRPSPPRGGTGRAGAIIVDIVPDGPAARAGLAIGDIVFRAGGRRIFRPAHLRTAIAMQPSGEALSIEAGRDGEKFRVEMLIAE